MVFEKDFEFKIVSVEDKIPFKEHRKGSKVYVEVEPNAEYLLSCRKIRNSSTDLQCRFKVDGKGLPTYNNFDAKEVQSTFYKGLTSRSKGFESKHAFKFVKASFVSHDRGMGPTMTGMGSVQMEVYAAKRRKKKKLISTKDFGGSFKASTININDSSVTKKKNLRSEKGCELETRRYDRETKLNSYKRGEHLYTITLNYCATPGLIAVGILPKPPAWSCTSVKRNRKGNEIVELVDSDSDSITHPARVPSNHKKIKLYSDS